jgi:outer membrane receptor protein involved in Fe transport
VKKPFEAAAYIQDKINFSSIILSLGLRFDLTDTNSDYWYSPYDVLVGDESLKRSSETHTQISPRLGISYPVSEKTVFHFGYGHYFQRAAYTYTYRMITDEEYNASMLRTLNSGNGLYGNPDLKPEKQIAYEFGLSHQFADDYLINVSIYSKKILDYIGTRTFFAGDFSPETGVEYDESFTVHINEDFGYNNGIELQLRKMRGRYLVGSMSYTYAVAEGSSSGPLERVGVEEANRQSLKFFPLNFDQRHTINANLSLRFQEGDAPAGIGFLENMNFSLLFQYGSGLPYTKGIRGATEPYELNNKRLPATWTLDLTIDRKIDLGSLSLFPYVEVFNLTDRENILSVDPFTGKPDFIEGRTRDWAANPENFGAPRLIYFGIRLQY